MFRRHEMDGGFIMDTMTFIGEAIALDSHGLMPAPVQRITLQ